MRERKGECERHRERHCRCQPPQPVNSRISGFTQFVELSLSLSHSLPLSLFSSFFPIYLEIIYMRATEVEAIVCEVWVSVVPIDKLLCGKDILNGGEGERESEKERRRRFRQWMAVK